MTLIIIIVIISITKVDNWIDKKITNYSLLSAKSFVFNITRLNWQYGFFTSTSQNYQYLKAQISLVDPEWDRSVLLTDNGSIEPFGCKLNSLRLNTAIQQIARDSIYLEAGSRAIALYLFNKNQLFRNVDFTIQAYNCNLSTKNNRFVMKYTIDTLFDRTLSY